MDWVRESMDLKNPRLDKSHKQKMHHKVQVVGPLGIEPSTY